MNAREKMFCEEYLIDLCPLQAALRAGYALATAKSANQWLNENHDHYKPAVCARIEQLKAERSVRTGISADRVIRELARLAFANPGDVIDMRNGGVQVGADDDDMAAIAAVRVKKGADFEEREVRMCDKARALELLGKHLGLFADRVRLEGAVPVIIDDTGDGDA